MADTLPSPPRSRPATPDLKLEKGGLTARLDELLEHYLGLLDQYTTLRDELSTTLSSAFFSLAQAQRASTLGASRRYGQECYDERMKAQREVKVETDSESSSVKYEVVKRAASELNVGELNNKLAEDEVNGEEIDHDEPAPDGIEEKSARRNVGRMALLKQNPASRDPLTWFGIFHPMSLRQTQSHFVTATDISIPALLNVKAKMRDAEDEIWSLRRDLGMLADYNTEGETIQQVKEEDPEALTVQRPAQEAARTSTRRRVTSRPAHSKSSLLKLGE